QCSCSVPEDLAVSGTDLCSLFSNLLDNAADAVDSLEPQRKTISLSSDLEGNVFTVRCENPYPGEESIRPSHRPDGHGLGLSILEDLAKRHQGELSISTEKDIFTATVWLFVSSN
ncbi:MAG: GHKL domain-containing protein, partial [Eubacterium sp.]|nr:GHKL domain-containing protein [Eubacterium sp.]